MYEDRPKKKIVRKECFRKIMIKEIKERADYRHSPMRGIEEIPWPGIKGSEGRFTKRYEDASEPPTMNWVIWRDVKERLRTKGKGNRTVLQK